MQLSVCHTTSEVFKKGGFHSACGAVRPQAGFLQVATSHENRSEKWFTERCGCDISTSECVRYEKKIIEEWVKEENV